MLFHDALRQYQPSSSTRIPTHVVICAREEALRGPESLPAYSCLLQINYNNSYNLFGARVLHFVLHFSPTYPLPTWLEGDRPPQ